MYRFRLSRLVLLLSLLGSGTGCSSGMRNNNIDTIAPNYSVLTRSELNAVTVTTNAFDAISVLRSRWLNTSRGPWAPTVVIDGVPVGDIENLRSIRIEQVKELRYVSARDATTRWGTNNSGGVIEVILGDFLR